MAWGVQGTRGGGGLRRSRGELAGNRPKPKILLPRAQLYAATIFLAAFLIPNVSLSEETNSAASNTSAAVTYDHVTDDVTPGDALIRIAARIHENEQLWWNIVNNTAYGGARKHDDDEDEDEDEILKPKARLLRLKLKETRGKNSKAKPKNVDKKCGKLRT